MMTTTMWMMIGTLEAMQDYRPQYEEAYEKVPGKQKNFGFRAISEGQVAQRQWDCHCHACLTTELSLSSYYVPGCMLGDTIAGKKNVEVWHGCSVERRDKQGVALQRKAAQAEGRKLASSRGCLSQLRLDMIMSRITRSGSQWMQVRAAPLLSR